MVHDKRIGRYTTPRGSEAQFQPGSRGRVLANLLGIQRRRDLDRAEYEALVKAKEAYLGRVAAETRFTCDLICRMHRDWLGGIYEWAGQYRGVDVEKGGFRWPPAVRVGQNMVRFEAELLARSTPCRPGEIAEDRKSVV